MANIFQGQRFGKLVALRPTAERRNGYVMWECKCDCGSIVLVRSSKLIDGSKQSCGCLQRDYVQSLKQDLSGQRFGRLVALRPTEERKRGLVVWECKCDCGNIVQVVNTCLLRNQTQSCGCLQKERASQSNIRDLSGQRFGKLVAQEPTELRKQSCVVWKCLCDCGKTALLSSRELLKGTITSCGCEAKKTTARDLSGQRFGRLVALRPTAERKNGFLVWECRCDCGNTAFVRSSSLTSGNNNSCGCARQDRKKKTSLVE